MSELAMERSQIAMGLAPVADFAGSDPVYSDVISMARHARVRFIVVWGVGTTGTIKFTVEACDDVVPTNVSAVAFTYRVTASGGTPGTITATTASTGYTNDAGSNQILECEIESSALLAAGYGFVRLKMDEITNDPILGGILVELLEPRHHGNALGAAVS